MNNRTLKVLIVAISLSWITDYLIAAIHTSLSFIPGFELDAPLSAYLVYGYTPLIVAGVYIGFSNTASKIQIGLLVAISYIIKRILLDGLFETDLRHSYPGNIIVILANLTILYILIVNGSLAITEIIRKKFA